MSLELRSSDVGVIDTLWKTWESTTEFELEATFKQLDYTNFLNVVKYLRTYGLTEEPQPPKLNIMVSGGLRFTIVGEGAIQAYCNDNTIRGKVYHVILKEKRHAAGATDVDLNEYGVRIKIRRELPLAKDDPRVMEAVAKWMTLPKSFRYIQRFSFTSLHHKGIVFDASFLRENKKDARGNYIQTTTFQGANITKQPVHYEVEVEALRGSLQKSLMFGIVTVLRGIQRSYVLVRESVKKQVVEQLVLQTQTPKGGFPGSQPVTLRKEHIAPEQNSTVPNIRFEDYNVTDKADGLRTLMIVAQDGKIFMVDRNLNVYGTDRRLASGAVDEWAGAVLDGEWITTNADNKPMSRFYAFDIFNGRRGEDVSRRPFLIRSTEPVVTRLAAMTETVAALNNAEYTVAAIPKHHSVTIMMKTFQTSASGVPEEIFREASSVLDRLTSTRPYHTDGLIFTPNNSPLPRNVNTWNAQFKWKPASMNSVDFLVITEKDRDSEGRATTTDAVSTRFREDTQQMVRYKTLRLHVGSADDPAFLDPRDTILNMKPYPSSKERVRGQYRPVEFAPQPPDPMGAVCYVAIDAGATDAAGAAPAARIGSSDDTIYCVESGDPISNQTIVEMVYDPSKPAGWRWSPMRVRWDKTEKFARRQIGGTLNSEDVANDVWLSIHDPITETMIRTGSMTEAVEEGGAAATNQMYYQRRAPQRDLRKVSGLADFHNRYIKEGILLARTLTAGGSILDMSVGQAGDIHKWIRSKAKFVLGCDIALTGITDNKNGAYRRYLDQLIQSRGSPLPKMVFVQADSAVHYADGSAGQTPLDRTLLRTLWGDAEGSSVPPFALELRGMAAAGFDVASLMFTLHYFFKDVSTLNGLLRNISESLKVGGYFVGCCFDGDKVVSLLSDVTTGGTKRGTEGAYDLWTITKQYEDTLVALADDESGLGKPIDVNIISIGESYTEYLVSWNYFVRRMGEIGMELLNPEELVTLGLQHSTSLFSTSYDMALAAGRNYTMSSALRTFSFLNRWFIFRRRSTGSSVANTPAPISLPAPIVPVPDATDTTAAEAPAAETAAEPAAEEAAAEEADAEPIDEAALSEAVAAPVLRVATGAAYPFYHKSVAKDDLKIKDKNWKRYISTFTPFAFRDVRNPSVTYPSLEAVLGAAKYQHATNKPELGAQLFSTVGNIHQSILEEQRKLTDGKRTLTAEEEATFMESEGTQLRNAQKPTEIRKTGAKFDVDKWNAVAESVLNDYLRQRFEGDPQFKKILEAAATLNGRLVYAVPNSTSELCGKVSDSGDIEGLNLYGRALMRLVGTTY